MKENYINKGIPIIFSEIGVQTESKRDKLSIREYLYSIFSISRNYNGFMPCLWDTSNKKYGNMNYYNRETDEWYDDKIKDIFSELSGNDVVNILDYYITTNIETIYETEDYGYYSIFLNNRKPLTLILNLSYKGELFTDYNFYISSFNKYDEFFDIIFGKENGKKQYDGTITYTFDLTNENCNKYIEIIQWYGEMNFNNVTIIFNESFIYFDYKSYKNEILKKVS